MIWLTWRQFRVRAIVAVAALAALATYMIILGVRSRTDYPSMVTGCDPAECTVTRHEFTNAYLGHFTLLSMLLLAVPLLIGIFWGAPLIASELESRTDRLVWNQSVTRTRWLAVKLAIVGLAAVVTAGLLSLLLTWSASRFDQYWGTRFTATVFGARNLVPAGHTLVAFVLGTVLGLVLRRTLTAMAVTAAALVVLQVAVPVVIRPHLMSPVTTTVRFDGDALAHADGFGIGPGGARIENYNLPGSWAMSSPNQVVNADGSAATHEQLQPCMAQGPGKADGCLGTLNLHFTYTYQPGSRYWAFQWIELSGYLVLSVLVAGFGFWWLRRRPS